MTVEQYVENQFKSIPESDEKQSVMDDLILTMNERVQDLVTDGKTEEDAVNKAIVDFGDLEEIKSGLKIINDKEIKDSQLRKYKSAFEFSLWGFILISALVTYINFQYNAGHAWFVYVIFGVSWWPLVMFYRLKNRRGK